MKLMVVLGKNMLPRTVLGVSRVFVVCMLDAFAIHDSPFAAQVPAWPGLFLFQ
ncbi:hypothetical protein A2U01_0036632, partial [Trifolium medium]|nr:hypothetical protein [Trifolium medium]